MDLFETLKISITAILANKTRSFLTMLGIMIGVFSVILLTALVSGLKQTITSQIAGLGSNLIYVIPGRTGTSGRGPGGATVNKLTLKDSTNLKNTLGDLADVSPVITKSAQIKFQNKSSKDASIFGTEANYLSVLQSVKLTEGRYFNSAESSSGKRVAVIGQTVYTNLFPNGGSPLNKTIQVSNLKYTIIGLLDKRGSIFGQDQDNVAGIPILSAQNQFGVTNVNFIYVNAKSPDTVAEVKQKTTEALLKRLSQDDFTVQDQAQTLSTINQVTGVLTAGLGGIAAISLIVGGIGIMNIMLVSVTERTREIGLRKALGAKPKDIRNQFLIEAVTLSGLGGLIGIIFGVLVAFLITPLIQTAITWWSIALSFGFSMLVGIVFGVAPALRASRLNPIQALRYE